MGKALRGLSGQVLEKECSVVRCRKVCLVGCLEKECRFAVLFPTVELFFWLLWNEFFVVTFNCAMGGESVHRTFCSSPD